MKHKLKGDGIFDDAKNFSIKLRLIQLTYLIKLQQMQMISLQKSNTEGQIYHLRLKRF
jgi:hypothetical protein